MGISQADGRWRSGRWSWCPKISGRCNRYTPICASGTCCFRTRLRLSLTCSRRGGWPTAWRSRTCATERTSGSATCGDCRDEMRRRGRCSKRRWRRLSGRAVPSPKTRCAPPFYATRRLPTKISFNSTWLGKTRQASDARSPSPNGPNPGRW